MLFCVVAVLIHVGWCSCWVSTDPSDDVIARCPLAACLSTAYAMRTSLSHVCSAAPSLACLTLLLMDNATVDLLGFKLDDAPNATAVENEAREASVWSNHVDLGWLPRVTKQQFVRLYHWAASRALPVEGGLVVLPVRNRCRVEFDREKDVFVMLRRDCE
jgi:hypothetical protein